MVKCTATSLCYLKMQDFTKIGEKVVQHQARKYGETKFGMNRFVHGFLDLITIWFLSRFGKRPNAFIWCFRVYYVYHGFGFAHSIWA